MRWLISGAIKTKQDVNDEEQGRCQQEPEADLVKAKWLIFEQGTAPHLPGGFFGMVEGVEQFRIALITFFLFEAEALQDDAVEPGRDVWVQLFRSRGRAMGRNLKSFNRAEWRPAGKTFIKGRANGKDFR